ncbi:MAG: hypothetical protein ABIN89_23055 [Chitinophagaceae bacterium]
MQFSQPLHELQYRHEIFRAKLEIRDHYIKTIVRDIYENTGQVLSLVRIQLTTLGTLVKDDLKIHLAESGELVGKAICDLRDMGKSFYPEKEILTESGFVNALKRELKVDLHDNTGKKVRVKGIPFALDPGCGLIFFQVILEITFLITRSFDDDSLRLQITYTSSKVKISMEYYGEPVDLSLSQEVSDEFLASSKLSLEERIKLIGGELLIKNKNGKKSKIVVSMQYDQLYAA